MKNKKLFLVVSFVFIWVTWISKGFPLEKATHQALNLNISKGEIDGFSLNSYLANTLGFKDGAAEPLSGYSEVFKKKMEQPVWDWVAEGGITEDEPDGLIGTLLNQGRSNNHFHNPLRPWNGAGLDDMVLGQRYTGQSSILWAQNPNQTFGGRWSWPEARKYFYDGLTAINKDAKDSAFAKTFRSLGQIMHLVEDGSVPAHVRNDIHILFNYEKWVERIRTSKSAEDVAKFKGFISNPISFDRSILEGTVNSWAPIPIAKIIDTEKYIYSNNPRTTSSTAIGIAEYTNANFFSEGTVFSDKFPFPALTSVTITDYSIPDPRDSQRAVMRKYYKKTGDGEVGYRLATVGFLGDYVTKYFPSYRYIARRSLDGGVYEDYASLLLPRAVGYSAGLLDYFFRGNLQVTAVPIFYKGELSFMKLKIKNLTPGEIMDGTFVLTYQYTPPRVGADSPQDIFGQAWAFDGSAVIPCVALREGDIMEADFVIYPAIRKIDYESIKFMLAFRGTLGNEEGAVIGKSFIPGDMVFNEEWDKELPGNYPWGHAGLNFLDGNPDNGSTGNVIVGGTTLVKDNIRFAGKRDARFNASFVSTFCCNEQFKPEGFPILVTPNTYLMFKIDAMSINAIPYSDPGTTRQWQGLWLYFDNDLKVEFSMNDQNVVYDEKTAIYTFYFGGNMLANIFQLFEAYGIPIPEGSFHLQRIDFLQQLGELDVSDPADIEYHQHMEVDFIQIIEGKEQ